jgi:uncharacterized protein YwgA
MSEQLSLKRQDIILSVISACEGSKKLGRTALQKLLYFVAIRFGINLGFEPYYYGPYSSLAESDVGSLVLGGMVKENRELLGFVGDSGLQARKYTYTLSDAGEARLEAVAAAHREPVDRIMEFTKSVISAANGIDQQVLAAAAKTYFIAHERGEPLSVEEISQHAEKHGWDLRPTQVNRVAEILTRLGLVDVS